MTGRRTRLSSDKLKGRQDSSTNDNSWQEENLHSDQSGMRGVQGPAYRRRPEESSMRLEAHTAPRSSAPRRHPLSLAELQKSPYAATALLHSLGSCTPPRTHSFSLRVPVTLGFETRAHIKNTSSPFVCKCYQMYERYVHCHQSERTSGSHCLARHITSSHQGLKLAEAQAEGVRRFASCPPTIPGTGNLLPKRVPHAHTRTRTRDTSAEASPASPSQGPSGPVKLNGRQTEIQDYTFQGPRWPHSSTCIF